MAVNKVIFGSSTILDLTNATASAADIRQGKTAYVADGTLVSGAFSGASGSSITLRDILNDNVSVITNTNITNIHKNCFLSCSNLQSINMPSVSAIGVGAFGFCESLEHAVFNDVTIIGGGAFKDCISLQTIVCPNVVSLGTWTFESCSSLEEVNFPNVTTLGNGTFDGCSNLRIISLPSLSEMTQYPFNAFSIPVSMYLPLSVDIDNGNLVIQAPSGHLTITFSGSSVGSFSDGAISILPEPSEEDSSASDSNSSDSSEYIELGPDYLTLRVPTGMYSECVSAWPSVYISCITTY